jgi:hypothetical protein
MQNPDSQLAPYLKTTGGVDNAKKTSWDGAGKGTVPSMAVVLKQMQADWVTLTGRSSGPQIVLAGEGGLMARNPCEVGMCYPQATSYAVESGAKSAPDAPFVNKGNAVRDPRYGFMEFDLDVVKALTDHGFTWGAIGFGGQSGDVMHFELTTLGNTLGAEARRATS